MSVVCASCGAPATDVVFYVYDGYTFTRAEQRTIETIAEVAALDARRLLPDLPDRLIVRVNPGKRVMEETGQAGSVSPPNIVYWTVDPYRPGGATAIAESQLRSTLFHEFHHLVREGAMDVTSIMDHVVSEGMATAFERDFGDAPTPWGTYPPDVSHWVKELIALPSDAPRQVWMSRHPDGRRWIGYKAGTYLADRAIRASGQSSAELVFASTADVLEWALADSSTQ